MQTSDASERRSQLQPCSALQLLCRLRRYVQTASVNHSSIMPLQRSCASLSSQVLVFLWVLGIYALAMWIRTWASVWMVVALHGLLFEVDMSSLGMSRHGLYLDEISASS